VLQNQKWLAYESSNLFVTSFLIGLLHAFCNLAGQFAENETNEVNFREIPSHVLSKVCMYFTYKVRYTNSSTEIPEFPIAPEIALELLMAANFLDC
uniref:Elongin-C n=2 Tax=Poecilia mexicana TaxID=48701 RepID=A0A3B3X9Z2_9TELE